MRERVLGKTTFGMTHRIFNLIRGQVLTLITMKGKGLVFPDQQLIANAKTAQVQYYISAARELSWLVGVCKASVLKQFQIYNIFETIRSFDQDSRFRDTNMKLVDGYSWPKFHIAGAMEWFCFCLDMLSSITFAYSLIFLIALLEGFISLAIAGLAVSYGLDLNTVQAWVIWNLCNMENTIISVERLFQYTSIPSEPPPLVIEENRPDHSWPSQGEIDIRDLQVRYTPHMPLVLRVLACTFMGGTKTGIVGRAGSDESTLIQTLFPIVEPAAACQIVVDGIKLSTSHLMDCMIYGLD